MSIKLIILGEPASMKNSRRLVKFANKPAFIKSKKALSFAKSALLQIPDSAKQMLAGDICFKAHIFYASRRPDLDESLIIDVLQAKVDKGNLIRRGVYLNDRQIKEKHVFWGLDKTNPRVEIEITLI
jgi:Holliday junction resolvase RusA-like endonuclease